MSGQTWDEWARATLTALLSATSPQARQERDELTRRAELAEAELARVTLQDNEWAREAISWIGWADDVARLPRVRSALQPGETYRAHIAHLLKQAREAEKVEPPRVAKHWAIMVDGAATPLWEGWQYDERAARLAWLDSPEFWHHLRAALDSAADAGDKLTQIRKAIGPFVVPSDPALTRLEKAET